MKLNFKSRSWHTWVSVILSLPILIVALTAVFIAHKKTLGTEDISVAAHWLPGYRTPAGKVRAIEVRAGFTTAAGRVYIGTQDGLLQLVDGKPAAVEALGTTQVRAIAEAPWGLVVAAKNGIWVEQDGAWQRAYKGDAWNAALHPDGKVLVAVKDKGLLESGDGKRWAADAGIAAALATLPAAAAQENISLGKLVMDLHTGKAFFGKDGEWIWIDLIGIAMSLLGLTGLWMWWRGEKRKAAIGSQGA